MRSVLVILAAIVVTVVAGGPAAVPEHSQAADRSTDRFIQRIAAGRRQRGRPTRVYVVQMADQPGHQLCRRRRRNREDGARVRRAIQRAVEPEPDVCPSILRRSRMPCSRESAPADRKIYSYRHAMNGFAARLSRRPGGRNAAQEQVGEERLGRPARCGLTPTTPRHFSGAERQRKACARGMRNLRGKGVIIGMIDTGAVQEHPEFR